MNSMVTFLIAYYGMVSRHIADHENVLDLLDEVEAAEKSDEVSGLVATVRGATQYELTAQRVLRTQLSESIASITGLEVTPETVANLFASASVREEE